MTIFHTYVDWTTEEIPRAFYVGKGNEFRTRNPERNQKHKHIRKTFGLRREVVFSSTSEKECFDQEILMIKEHHTFYHDDLADKEVACNFTIGGDGAAGWVPTDEQKKNISDGLKRTHRDHPEIAEGISKRAKIRMNDPNFVKAVSEKIRESLRNMPDSKKKEMRMKAAISNTGRISPQRGENCWRTTLNDESVRQIKKEYAILRDSCNKTNAVNLLCEKYQQGYNAIFKIVSGVTWKHIEV
jgi:hypothetical protein